MAHHILNATFLLLLLAIVAIFAAPCSAWWCTGHMTVATIAKSHMSFKAQDKASAILKDLQAMGPFPKSPDFVQMACWADDLKRDNRAMAGWHFLNQPIVKGSYQVPKYEWPVQKMNVGEAINQMYDAISKTKSYYNYNKFQASFALANFIHFMGDISQPLHTTELFSEQFPHGDMGGNLFPVYATGKEWKLHFVWDSICTTENSPNRPMNSTDAEHVTELAKRFESMHSFTEAEIKMHNTTIFGQESHALAFSAAYDNLKLETGTTLTPQYLQNCMNVASRQIALAGRRLGSELEYLFGDDYENGVAHPQYTHRKPGMSATDALLIRMQKAHDEYNAFVGDMTAVLARAKKVTKTTTAKRH